MFRISDLYWKLPDHLIHSTNNTIGDEGVYDRSNEVGKEGVQKYQSKVDSHLGLIKLKYFIIYNCMLHVYISTVEAIVNSLRHFNLRHLNVVCQTVFKIPVTKYSYFTDIIIDHKKQSHSLIDW